MLDRNVAYALRGYNESPLFFRGMIAWLGFKQFGIRYTPEERFSGATKYTLKKMISFALSGITSFSVKPLQISMFLGIALSSLAFFYALYALIIKFYTNSVIHGWASVLVSVLFLGGVQLIMLGIIGEYLGKLFLASKHRPLYIIREKSRGFTD